MQTDTQTGTLHRQTIKTSKLNRQTDKFVCYTDETGTFHRQTDKNARYTDRQTNLYVTQKDI